jgi:hypothetical protein
MWANDRGCAVKNWTTGVVVAMGDLNELVCSSNLSFATAAARDTFLVGALAPVQGMTVYLQDVKVSYKRITVAGTSYWAPAPGTHLVSESWASATPLPAGVATQILNLTILRTRNLATMWANNRFTPTIPGFYEFDAAINMPNTVTDGYRAAWLSLNGASVATAMPGSWNQLYPAGSATGASTSTVPVRPVSYYFNGTDGSYVTLMGMNGAATDLQTSASGTCFSAKYLGM